MAIKMPPKPDMADDEDAGAAPDAGGADDMGGGDEDAGGDQSGRVLCTILTNPGGGYTLVSGDEDDGGEGGEAGTDEMGGDMGAKPEGQTFPDKGAALKAVLDIMNKSEEASGGTNQSHFESGFGGSGAPTPKKAAPPQY